MNHIKFDPDESYYFHKGVSKRVAETGASWPHYHSLYEIYFMLAGNCTYVIDNKVYKVQAGDLVIIPDGIIHHTKYDNVDHKRILINCAVRYIPLSVISGCVSGVCIYRNPDVVGEITDILGKIEREYEANDKYRDEIITCHTHALFFLLVRNDNICLDAEVKNKVIEQAVAYIKENFSSAVSLSEIAAMYSLSPEHFSRMFKKETGLGFSKYLNSLRLQHAEQLLKSAQGQNITEVAESCGFEDSNYFSKKFKEMYGVAPKKLQKNGRGER